MAILTKIRNRAGLAVGFVGFALVAFIVSDALNSNVSIFGGNDTSVAVIGGDEVDYREFENVFNFQKYEFAVKGKKTSLDPAEEDQVRDFSWQVLLREKIFIPEYKKLGIDKITPDELKDMIVGRNPDPLITRYFDPSNYSGQMAMQTIASIQSGTDQASKNQWNAIEREIEMARVEFKYAALVKAGVYTTELETRLNYLAQNRSADFKFVSLNFNTISDSAVKVTDEEIQEFYNENKWRYKQEKSRDLKYVTFDVVPSGDDSLESGTLLKEALEVFRNSANDSQLMASAGKFNVDTGYYGRGQFPGNLKPLEDTIVRSTPGTVWGPAMEGTEYKITRLLGVRLDSQAWLKASHILIKYKNEKPTGQDSAEALKRANEIWDEILKGKNFEEAARSYGQDGSAQNGGDLGWTRESGWFTEFAEGVKTHQKGDVFVIFSRAGAHVIKVTENKTYNLYGLATTGIQLRPSAKTEELVYKKAEEFRSKVTNVESFEKTAIQQNLMVKDAPKINTASPYVGDFDKPKELIQWMYGEEIEKGAVSDILRLGNRYVVAILTGIHQKGISTLDEVKDLVTAGAKKKKKVKQFTERMEKALKDGPKTTEELAIKLGTIANEVPGQTLSNDNINFAGAEPALLGAIFGTTKTGTFSKVIEGINGVYVFMITKFNEPQPIPDVKESTKFMNTMVKQSVQNSAQSALREAAEVEDKRYRWGI